MTREEQNVFLNEEYAEAVRYMDNAKEVLLKAKKDGSVYTDKKYVRMACGTAYSGVMLALDAWFVIKEIPKPDKKQRKSIEYYMSNITKIDKKLVSLLHSVYDTLHLDGYYDGITSVKVINAGLEDAYEIIDKIKPENPVEVKESKANAVKRVFNKLQILIAVMFIYR
ncbi:MAG: DUF5618 family protein [Chitinivibrionia bacterium]|nr:DUF5618 family protein [Chitinivibrionia bacterium]